MIFNWVWTVACVWLFSRVVGPMIAPTHTQLLSCVCMKHAVEFSRTDSHCMFFAHGRAARLGWPHQAHTRHTHDARTHKHARTPPATTHPPTPPPTHTHARLELVQVRDPPLAAPQLGGDDGAQPGVAEREPAALGDAVGLVLKLLGPQLVEVLRVCCVCVRACVCVCVRVCVCVCVCGWIRPVLQ